MITLSQSHLMYPICYMYKHFKIYTHFFKHKIQIHYNSDTEAIKPSQGANIVKLPLIEGKYINVD